MLLSTIRWLALAAIILGPTCAMAQTSAAPTATSSAQPLKPAELDQLVAPIALYPDPLLAQVLMASAYPLDIVQAERWLEANKTLKGDALKAAVDKQSWDDSVKSLVATPDVLQLMSSKLDWTEKLGDAVVAQQAAVMDAIQRLRAKAQANNKLQSTKEQTVNVIPAPSGGQGGGGNYWGGGLNWRNNNIAINRPTNPIANPGRDWKPSGDRRPGGAGNRP